MIKSIFFKTKDIKPKYYIQMIENLKTHIWNVNVDFIYENENRHEEGINLLIPKTNNNTRISVIKLEILPEDYSKNILERKVFIEKKGCIKSLEEDLMIKWSIEEMFSSIRFRNTKNFKLTKIEDSLSPEKNWILSDCSLINSDMWSNGNYTMNKITAPINVTIYPKNIFNYI